MFFRTAVVAVTLLAFTGCTTLQTFQDTKPTPASISQEVRPGDHVRIVANDLAYDLDVSAVEPDAILGADSLGKTYRVHFAAIKSLVVERRETSGGGIVAGIVGGVVLVYGILCAIALYSLSRISND